MIKVPTTPGEMLDVLAEFVQVEGRWSRTMRLVIQSVSPKSAYMWVRAGNKLFVVSAAEVVEDKPSGA